MYTTVHHHAVRPSGSPRRALGLLISAIRRRGPWQGRAGGGTIAHNEGGAQPMPAFNDGIAETEIPAGPAVETDVLIVGSGPAGGAAPPHLRPLRGAQHIATQA